MESPSNEVHAAMAAAGRKRHFRFWATGRRRPPMGRYSSTAGFDPCVPVGQRGGSSGSGRRSLLRVEVASYAPNIDGRDRRAVRSMARATVWKSGAGRSCPIPSINIISAFGIEAAVS
jgi:hypothetical protein